MHLFGVNQIYNRKKTHLVTSVCGIRTPDLQIVKQTHSELGHSARWSTQDKFAT